MRRAHVGFGIKVIIHVFQRTEKYVVWVTRVINVCNIQDGFFWDVLKDRYINQADKVMKGCFEILENKLI